MSVAICNILNMSGKVFHEKKEYPGFSISYCLDGTNEWKELIVKDFWDYLFIEDNLPENSFGSILTNGGHTGHFFESKKNALKMLYPWLNEHIAE